ncbi:BnaA05g33970D [Brassica napus]|uniref:BnaA05g33970D protein n=1 Tax=Brassica napus TaxID=3708 RepID=A0A078HI91_BRANA|nr:BnaA05g33970D [Brassica napus]
MFIVLALVSALVFLQSEAGNYCPLENINSIPGCFDALKLATGKDISKLTRACCRAVFSQTNVMFMVLALVSALVFLQSEAGNYCPLENINSIPGCFDALKLATGKDISKLTRACCRAVFSVSSDTCYLLLFPGKAYPIKIFRDICLNVNYALYKNDFQTNVMFMVLALVSALVFLQSEAGNYCPTENINSIPGCFDALKLASGKDYRRLTRGCCRAVFSVIPDTCFLLLFPGKAYPIKMFRNICLNVNYVSAASPF